MPRTLVSRTFLLMQDVMRPKGLALAGVAIFVVLAAMMIDKVHLEGSHTSYLVIAPYPTPRFVYGGGEEGAWVSKNPNQPKPWWLTRRYFVLAEVTDG